MPSPLDTYIPTWKNNFNPLRERINKSEQIQRLTKVLFVNKTIRPFHILTVTVRRFLWAGNPPQLCVELFEPQLHVYSMYSVIDPHHSHLLLLASHSLRSISLGSTTSSLRSTSITRIFVYSNSKYCFFSSAGGFFPFGFVFDFLQHRRKEDRL